MIKVFGFLILMGVGSFLLFGKENYQDFSSKVKIDGNDFEQSVLDDLISLKSKKGVPKEIQQLGSVQWLDHRKEKFAFNSNQVLAAAFPKKEKGKYQILAEAYDVSESQDPEVEKDQRTLFLQISLFDLKSKNKIFEITRSYLVPDTVK